MEFKMSLEKEKVIVIVRRIYGESLQRLAQSLVRGGIKFIEVTFDQAEDQCIEKTCRAVKDLKGISAELEVGVGTTLTVEQVEAAADAGASFVISPNVRAEVIRKTKQLGMISIPGAMTPSEIFDAYTSGADYVKVFPAGYLGVDYIRDIRAPLPHIPLLAAGGVDISNLDKFIECGYRAVGIGSYLANKTLLDQGKYACIEERTKLIVNKVKEI